MSHPDSSLVKLRNPYFLSVVMGATGSFIFCMLDSVSLETTMTAGIIGGLSLSTAELISFLGKTWWLKLLLWGTTMGIIGSALIRLLLPSVDFDSMHIFTPSLTYGLINNLVLSRAKKR
ncbi:hypothetical protein SD81_036590 [Tolypothrix campylonemoides VB511288]|nr:hypothetical protein SD81_036590 [Tolypothrix campylonemoides VB511288]